MRAGVAISPDTLSTAITDEVANAADMLLVMTVYPGVCLRAEAIPMHTHSHPISARQDAVARNSSIGVSPK